VVSRWDKLDNCLEAVLNGSMVPDELLVLDNSNHPGTNPVLNQHDISVISEESKIGPSKARKQLADEASEDKVMFIDADVVPKPDSIESMYEKLCSTDYRSVSGIWSDYGEFYQRVGNSLIFDEVGGNVLKQPISYRDVQDFSTLVLEFSTPLLMVEQDLFDEIQFDPNYKFYFEWWDLFMQMNEINEYVLCDLDALFIHRPGGYDGGASNRHGDYDPDLDKEYFQSKWGYEPVNTTHDDGTYNDSSVNKKLSYLLGLFDIAQKRKL
jgi:glycosyltransferase involved in cell wall biosynthesis